jgi:hypothetical protein
MSGIVELHEPLKLRAVGDSLDWLSKPLRPRICNLLARSYRLLRMVMTDEPVLVRFQPQ